MFQEFNHPIGLKLRAHRGCLDTRYQTSTARKWCRANRGKGAVAVTGSNQLGVPLLNGKRKDPETNIQVWSIGTHEAKDLIYQHVELEHDPEADEGGLPHGYMHWPKLECYRERYFDGLLAEDSASPTGRLPPARRGAQILSFIHKNKCATSRCVRCVTLKRKNPPRFENVHPPAP